MKNLIKKIKGYWNAQKPTNEEIKVATMLNILFQEQTTEQVIDTLILFEEKAKARLKEIIQQAEKDRFVTDFYLGTSIKQPFKV